MCLQTQHVLSHYPKRHIYSDHVSKIDLFLLTGSEMILTLLFLFNSVPRVKAKTI